MSKLSDAVTQVEMSMRESAETTRSGFGGPDYREDILRAIGLDPSNVVAHAVVAVAKRYALDPVLGHIAIIPRANRPYITRDGFLHIAHRSGQLDGIEVVDGPRRDGREWHAIVSVHRKDMAHAFTYPGRADLGADNGPEMAITRAERRALKRAFAVTLPREFADETEPNTPLSPPASTESPEKPSPGMTVSPDQPRAGEMISESQRRALFAQWQRLGLASDEKRDERLNDIDVIVGHPVKTTNELTRDEASLVISVLRNREAKQ